MKFNFYKLTDKILAVFYDMLEEVIIDTLMYCVVVALLLISLGALCIHISHSSSSGRENISVLNSSSGVIHFRINGRIFQTSVDNAAGRSVPL